jgi:hypothetical protein
MSATIYIASMNLRGNWAPAPENTTILNATSAQRKTSPERLAFSPMTEIPNGYKGYYCFENYWQGGKVYESIPEDVSKKWWKELKQPKRKYPRAKNVLHSNYDGVIRDYITSRKQVYVPEYYELIKNNPTTKKWVNFAKSGMSIVVYDFDGPRDKTGKPICLPVNLDLLIEKINDTKYPFGHGYVIAGVLAGIHPNKYIH